MFGALRRSLELTEDQMKQVIKMAILAGAIVPTFADVPAGAQNQAQNQAQNEVCIPDLGCVRAEQAAYNRCFELSQKRGVSEEMSRAERWFIYQCLKGEIPMQALR
jgi:hypothetical protein